MIRLHMFTFFAAAIMNLCACIILKYQNDEELSQETRDKLFIASRALLMLDIVLWSMTHYIMLVVFIRYGNPIEDDERKLLRNNIESSNGHANSPLNAAERKLKAYQDLADRQVSIIWRAMNGYRVLPSDSDRSNSDHKSKNVKLVDMPDGPQGSSWNQAILV